MFVCRQNSWLPCWMRILLSCSVVPPWQRGWSYTEVPKQRWMQLLGPSERKFQFCLVEIIWFYEMGSALSFFYSWYHFIS